MSKASFKANKYVQTPLGCGYIQGMDAVSRKYIVRLPVNDTTRPLLDESFGTPNATSSGLWLFTSDEITFGVRNKNSHRPRKVKMVKPPSKSRASGPSLSSVIRKMQLSGAPLEDIYTAAVAHEKYQNDAKKARSYVRTYIRYMKKSK